MTVAVTNGKAAAASLEPLPPEHLEAEEHVLGAMMLPGVPAAVIDAICDELEPGDFSRPSHAVICRAIFDLFYAGKPTEPISVIEQLALMGELESVGEERIREIATRVPAHGSEAYAARHAQIVRNHAHSRRVIAVGAAIQQIGWDPTVEPDVKVDRAQELAYRLSERRGTGQMTRLGDAAKRMFDRISERAESGTEIIGAPTGFQKLDRLTGGLEPGNLIVLAARPSMGKSALAGAVGAHLAIRCELPVALFSFEMSREMLLLRDLAREANVDLEKLRNPGRRLTQDEFSRLLRAVGTVAQAPIYSYHRDNTLPALRREIRRLKTREPELALVVVDYLQLMSEQAGNRYEEVTKISAGLKKVAVEFDVPVLALSQLSRAVEARTDKRPQLSDLRDSGSIEQDADFVIFLYREGYYRKDTEYPNLAELDVAKARNAPTGRVELYWDESHTTFREVTSR